MMKLLVETTGSFMLVNPLTGFEFPHQRPCVCSSDNFVQQRVTLGHLHTLTTLPDEANDEDFASYWKECEGDKALAIASYQASFGAPEEPLFPEDSEVPEDGVEVAMQNPPLKGRRKKNG